jgi:3-deoxy-D-manno-octulosonic-acid transferase
MSRFLYTLLYYVLTPLLFLRVIIKHYKSSEYKNERQPLRLNERLGLFSAPKFNLKPELNIKPELNTVPGGTTAPVWIHTVSVGEFIATLPLIKKIQQEFPQLPLVITCTTTTGSAQIYKVFSQQINSKQVFHVYLPYDLPGSVQRFLSKVKPCVGIIMETEIWPNLFAAAKCSSVPLYLLNARMSARSAKGYQRFARLSEQTLRTLSGIAVQDSLGAKRLLELGALNETLQVTGSIKFDIKVSDQAIQQGKQLRQQLGWKLNKVLIAASTHQGEDEILLQIYQSLRLNHPELVMLIVPRHPERFQQVFQMLETSGLNVLKRTDMGKNSYMGIDILLGDTMGEMMNYFACSDLVIMGGTLVPTGGHNIIEPAVLGLAIVYGPYMFNFHAINELFLEYEAALQAQGSKQLKEFLHQLLTDDERCQMMGEKAKQLVEQNAGALDKMFAMIHPYLH